jgi:hypothetical protein
MLTGHSSSMRTIAFRSTITLLTVMITFMFSVHTVAAQTQRLAAIPGHERTPCTQDTRISLENIEKYDWRWCKLDLHPFWNGLQIPAGRFSQSESLFSASSTYGDLDGDGIQERLLHLSSEFNQVTRIMVLKPPTAQVNQWTTVAFLDLDTFHLYPEARVVTNGRERWLAVSHIEKAWGTGIYQENETWYTLSNGRFQARVSFPVEGHLNEVGIPAVALGFTTSVDPSPFAGSRDVITVHYTTTVEDLSDLPIRTTVRFSKSPSASTFAFDPARSTISSADFLAIFNIDSGKFTEQRFLNFAYPTLRVVAQRDAELREWLGDLLQSCDATTQKVCVDLTNLLKPRRR